MLSSTQWFHKPSTTNTPHRLCQLQHFLPTMVSEDQLNKLMDLVKIPIKKRNFDELHDQIQNLIEENDSFKSYFLSKHDNTLEKILNIPGLQHLAENIFGNLNFQYLKICWGINKSSKQILDNQMDKLHVENIYILWSFKEEPKRLDQSNPICEEFWEGKTYQCLSDLEFEAERFCVVYSPVTLLFSGWSSMLYQSSCSRCL